MEDLDKTSNISEKTSEKTLVIVPGGEKRVKDLIYDKLSEHLEKNSSESDEEENTSLLKNKEYKGAIVFEPNRNKTWQKNNCIINLNSIIQRDFTSEEQVVDALEEVDELELNYMKERGLYYLPANFPTFFDTYRDCLIDELDKYIPTWYKIPFEMMGNEIINGYNLFSVKEERRNFIRYDNFIKLKQAYESTEVYTKEEFYEKFDDTACSEWTKCNENGEYYVGYWEFPEGTEERNNAWTLTREKNIEALLKLPYSHDLIFEAIRVGCSSYEDSVKFVNFLCEYVRRKMVMKYEHDN